MCYVLYKECCGPYEIFSAAQLPDSDGIVQVVRLVDPERVTIQTAHISHFGFPYSAELQGKMIVEWVKPLTRERKLQWCSARYWTSSGAGRSRESTLAERLTFWVKIAASDWLGHIGHIGSKLALWGLIRIPHAVLGCPNRNTFWQIPGIPPTQWTQDG